MPKSPYLFVALATTLQAIKSNPIPPAFAQSPVEYLSKSTAKTPNSQKSKLELEELKKNLEYYQSRWGTQTRAHAGAEQSETGQVVTQHKEITGELIQKLPGGFEGTLNLSNKSPLNSQTPPGVGSYNGWGLEFSQNLWPNFLGRSQGLAEKKAFLEFKNQELVHRKTLILECQNLARIAWIHLGGLSNLKVFKELLTKAKKLEKWAEQAYKERRIRKLDLLLIKEQAIETENKLGEIQITFEQNLLEFKNLGVSPPNIEVIEWKREFEKIKSSVSLDPSAFDPKLTPEVRMAQTKLEIADLSLNLKEQESSLNLSHSAEVSDVQSPSAALEKTDLSYRLNLSVPLWDPKWNRDVAVARIEKEKAQLLYKTEIQNSVVQHEKRLNHLRGTEDSLFASQKTLDLSRQKEKEARRILELGQAGFFEYSSFDKGLMQAEMTYLEKFGEWVEAILQVAEYSPQIDALCLPDTRESL